VLSNFTLLADYARDHGRPAVVARTPLVPVHTATEANIRAIGKFLAPWRPAVAWELLDFNPMARSKYAALGRTDYAFDTLTKGLPADELERLWLAAGVSPTLPQELSPS
jgi:pyruvate formate lyase activating enzyme